MFAALFVIQKSLAGSQFECQCQCIFHLVMIYILFFIRLTFYWIRNLQFCPGGARVVGQSPVWWPRQLQAWLEHAVHTNRSFGRIVRASTLSLWHSVRVSTSFGRIVLHTGSLLFWTCSAYKYVQFLTYSALSTRWFCHAYNSLQILEPLSCIAEQWAWTMPKYGLAWRRHCHS